LITLRSRAILPFCLQITRLRLLIPLHWMVTRLPLDILRFHLRSFTLRSRWLLPFVRFIFRFVCWIHPVRLFSFARYPHAACAHHYTRTTGFTTTVADFAWVLPYHWVSDSDSADARFTADSASSTCRSCRCAVTRCSCVAGFTCTAHVTILRGYLLRTTGYCARSALRATPRTVVPRGCAGAFCCARYARCSTAPLITPFTPRYAQVAVTRLLIGSLQLPVFTAPLLFTFITITAVDYVRCSSRALRYRFVHYRLLRRWYRTLILAPLVCLPRLILGVILVTFVALRTAILRYRVTLIWDAPGSFYTHRIAHHCRTVSRMDTWLPHHGLHVAFSFLFVRLRLPGFAPHATLRPVGLRLPTARFLCVSPGFPVAAFCCVSPVPSCTLFGYAPFCCCLPPRSCRRLDSLRPVTAFCAPRYLRFTGSCHWTCCSFAYWFRITRVCNLTDCRYRLRGLRVAAAVRATGFFWIRTAPPTVRVFAVFLRVRTVARALPPG